MNLGIFAKIFSRPDVGAILDAIVEHDLKYVQFNWLCAGLPTLPESIPAGCIQRIRSAFESRGLVMAAISGTFNMTHPYPAKRQRDLQRFETLTSACRALGTSVITLCTGTRDAQNMWRAHPLNQSREALDDLRRSMEACLDIAERHDVLLGIEPEVGNIIDCAAKARALLDQFHSPRLKIVMDPANLFHQGELPRMRPILNEAFDLLGPYIVLAHAKDLSADGHASQQAAGTGVLDYDYYLQQLQRTGFGGPLILHGLNENQVESCLQFLRNKLAALQPVPILG